VRNDRGAVLTLTIIRINNSSAPLTRVVCVARCRGRRRASRYFFARHLIPAWRGREGGEERQR